MNLPNGITGFYDSEANKPPQIDGQLFKQLCFSIASLHSGNIIDFKAPHYPANFYVAQVRILDNLFSIMLNEHYPYLAFASVNEDRSFTFIDAPLLHAHFSPFYHLLDAALLNKPFTPSLNTELNSAEWEQIAYWKPETIGQIIFNKWD